jgi:hypothetical protein
MIMINACPRSDFLILGVAILSSLFLRRLLPPESHFVDGRRCAACILACTSPDALNKKASPERACFLFKTIRLN